MNKECDLLDFFSISRDLGSLFYLFYPPDTIIPNLFNNLGAAKDL